MTILELFDLTHTLAVPYLRQFTYPWEALEGIGEMIVTLGQSLNADYENSSPQVWIHKTSRIAPSASITGPCIIGAGTEIRHCAFIRGNALIGEGCVVGNSTELKNVILFDGVQVPHYNYVGDSILGYKAHMGAGAITSNVKSDKTPVVIHGDQDHKTGRKKVGAMIGDFAEIGCGCVLNPGTIIGPNSQVYPLTSVRGTIPANAICKSTAQIVNKR